MRLRSAAVALGASAVLAGCGSSDHTVGHVRILNDTGRAVVVARCKDEACHSPTAASVVRPGSGGMVAVSVIGVPNPFVVMTRTGQRLGCLPIVLPHYVSGLVARVSKKKWCRDSYSNKVQWPRS
jgi:hypothetical protein